MDLQSSFNVNKASGHSGGIVIGLIKLNAKVESRFTAYISGIKPLGDVKCVRVGVSGYNPIRVPNFFLERVPGYP